MPPSPFYFTHNPACFSILPPKDKEECPLLPHIIWISYVFSENGQMHS